jgi:hypothetical protein
VPTCAHCSFAACSGDPVRAWTRRWTCPVGCRRSDAAPQLRRLVKIELVVVRRDADHLDRRRRAHRSPGRGFIAIAPLLETPRPTTSSGRRSHRSPGRRSSTADCDLYRSSSTALERHRSRRLRTTRPVMGEPRIVGVAGVAKGDATLIQIVDSSSSSNANECLVSDEGGANAYGSWAPKLAQDNGKALCRGRKRFGVRVDQVGDRILIGSQELTLLALGAGGVWGEALCPSTRPRPRRRASGRVRPCANEHSEALAGSLG